MQHDWQKFLESRGALVVDGIVQAFPDSDGNELHTGIADLSALGLLSVTGADRLAFVQSQFSNDINQLSANRHQLTAYATPKGRMIAVMRAFSIGERVELLLPEALREAVQQRLQMYVLRAQVQLDSDNPTLARLGVFGTGAQAAMSAVGITTPSPAEFAHEDGCTVLGIEGSTPRYLVIAEYERAMELWTAMEAHASPAIDEAWRCLDIEAGLPNVYPQTREAFTPQMVNLDLVGGVSFDKGCYPGQEVIARTHYLGRAKRRTRLGLVETSDVLEPGMTLYDDQAQPAGQIVDAARGPDGDYRVLMVLPLDSDATVFIDPGTTTPVRGAPLPYPTDAKVA